MEELSPIDQVSKMVGNRSIVARSIGASVNTLWDWSRQKKAITPTHVFKLAQMSGGTMPPHYFRSDVFGFMEKAASMSRKRWSADAIAAAMLLSYHQVSTDAAAWLEGKGWSRDQARAAVDELTDKRFKWIKEFVAVERPKRVWAQGGVQ